jgi:hypothetical protein
MKTNFVIRYGGLYFAGFAIAGTMICLWLHDAELAVKYPTKERAANVASALNFKAFSVEAA